MTYYSKVDKNCLKHIAFYTSIVEQPVCSLYLCPNAPYATIADSYSMSLHDTVLLAESSIQPHFSHISKLPELYPYILFIQNRFYNLVHDLHKGKYVDEDTGLTIYCGFYYTTEEWSDNTERVKQAAVLLKAFIEIQNTLTVPDWFKEEYQRLEALELLEA